MNNSTEMQLQVILTAVLTGNPAPIRRHVGCYDSSPGSFPSRDRRSRGGGHGSCGAGIPALLPPLLVQRGGSRRQVWRDRALAGHFQLTLTFSCF